MVLQYIETAQLDGETNRKPRRALLAELASTAVDADAATMKLCKRQHELGTAQEARRDRW
eukprot:gene6506-3938_t